jgi:stage II sporulation protein AA (anti-sigma F factor antagonist)
MASDARVLVMPERFDAAAVQESRAQWEAQAVGGTVIADMSGTKFIDSTGVGMLMRLRRLAREQNAAFALANVVPSVWKNIELMKLAEFFPVGPNVDSAWQIAQDARQQTLDACPIAGGIALQLQGELTESTSEESFAHCAKHLKSVVPGQKIMLDLSGVRFIDSSGIAVLVRLRKLVRSFGAEVEMTSPTPAVANVMRASGLAALLLNAVECKSE